MDRIVLKLAHKCLDFDQFHIEFIPYVSPMYDFDPRNSIMSSDLTHNQGSMSSLNSETKFWV